MSLLCQVECTEFGYGRRPQTVTILQLFCHLPIYDFCTFSVISTFADFDWRVALKF